MAEIEHTAENDAPLEPRSMIRWYRARRLHRHLAQEAHLRSIFGSTLLQGLLAAGRTPEEVQRILQVELARWDALRSPDPDRGEEEVGA